MPIGFPVRNYFQMRLARRFRWGLLKSRSHAELAFEDLLKEMNLRFTSQAIFLDRSTFFIVDFFIKFPHHLAVEIDGSNHGKKKRAWRDAAQKAYFERSEYRLLRFTDTQVLNHMALVKTCLQNQLVKKEMNIHD